MDRPPSDTDRTTPGGDATAAAGSGSVASTTSRSASASPTTPRSDERAAAPATGARTSAAAGGDGPGARPPIAAPEPRQRWRLTFARDELPSDRVGRSLLEDWHDALHASGLPIVIQDGDSNRPRLAFAAPLPAAARGDAELADIWLLERVPLWRFRESLESRLPVGHRWLAAEDVWL